MKPDLLPFAISVLLSFIAWGAVSLRYFWPRLRNLDLRSAAEPILYLHLFRFIGLSFLVPGVVGAGLDPHWVYPEAYGDLVASLLAGLALLSGRGALFRMALWAFSVWGSIDLLRAAILGPVYDVVSHLHAAYFIPVLGVPLLLWTHVLLFGLLLRRREPRTDLAAKAPLPT